MTPPAPGLYRVTWKDDPDRKSLASVGMCANGTRWIAPVNWLYPSASPSVWDDIAALERLVLDEDDTRGTHAKQ